MAKAEHDDEIKALRKQLKALRGEKPSAAEKPDRRKKPKADRPMAEKRGGKAEVKVSTKAVKVAKPISPLAPAHFPQLPRIAGVEFAAVAAGVRYQNRKDVMLIRFAPGTAMAGLFTRSSTRSGCVRDCQAKLRLKVPVGAAAAIIVNSGNSNAFTGKIGDKAVAAVTQGAAEALGIPATRVFSASTGVIGEPLPYEKITAALPALVAGLDEAAVEMAAHAMMTTDTFPKGASASVPGDNGEIQIAGIAKGSGMIAPDMATMLVYLFTDAKIAAPLLQKMLARQVGATFNSITVDSDTSTSDTLLIGATGQSTAGEVKGAVAKAFETALGGVMRNLAHQVIRDGEGATKFVEIRVSGAKTADDAGKVAFAVANSPLVKTALAGEDPNWGRIVAAIGKSGAQADRDRLTIKLGDILVARNGWRNPAYLEEDGAAYMRQSDLVIGIDLGLGRAKRSVWTCDLTKGYIEINADYRS